jgi:hypothetical protein
VVVYPYLANSVSCSILQVQSEQYRTHTERWALLVQTQHRQAPQSSAVAGSAAAVWKEYYLTNNATASVCSADSQEHCIRVAVSLLAAVYTAYMISSGTIIATMTALLHMQRPPDK